MRGIHGSSSNGGVGLVGMVAASALRARWKSVLLLTLVVAAVGAVTFASIAGARRTASALRRMNESSAAANVELVMVGTPTTAQRRALERVRGVETVTALRAPGVQVPALFDLQSIGIPEDAHFGVTIDRARVIAGRAADESAADEVTIGEGLAKRVLGGVEGQVTYVQTISHDAFSILAPEVVRLRRASDEGDLVRKAD